MIRTRSTLIVKGVVVLALAIAGYCALARSLAIVVAKTDPILASGVWGGDARIMSAAAQRLIERNEGKEGFQQAVSLAEKALRRDGTAVLAVDTLGFAAGINTDEQSAVRWFAYSEKLSRRDLRTQLYFVEYFVGRGDVKEALHHYDIALRTSDVSAPATLFPILRNATSDATIRRELARTLAANPIWANSFLIDLTNNGPDFPAAAQLLADMHRLGAPISVGLEAALVNNLVARNAVSTAWRFYVLLHPNVGSSLVRNGKFKTNNAENSPFDWQLPSIDGVSVEIGPSGNGGVLDYRLSPTTPATVARQLTFLPRGKYRLESVLIATSQRIGDGPYWQITCVDGRTIGKLEMGGPMAMSRSFSTEIVVPSDCGLQTLSFTVRASDDVGGASGQLGSIAISSEQ